MPSMVEVLGCPMGSRHLSLLGEYWEMNSTAVSPCWHRVSRGWWMLSPSLLPLWWRAVGQGAAGAPRSKPRGPEQRRRCGSLQEVMKAVFPLPHHASQHTSRDMVGWPSPNTTRSLFPSHRHWPQR